jgi:hypothetical protein
MILLPAAGATESARVDEAGQINTPHAMAELRIWQIKEIRPNKHIRKDSSEHAQLDVKLSTLHEYQGSLTTNVKKQQNAELKHVGLSRK